MNEDEKVTEILREMTHEERLKAFVAVLKRTYLRRQKGWRPILEKKRIKYQERSLR